MNSVYRDTREVRAGREASIERLAPKTDIGSVEHGSYPGTGGPALLMVQVESGVLGCIF